MRKMDQDELMSFAEKIGRLLDGGEVIELLGDVGSGKTTFTKGLARGLEIDDPIQSPTFTINRIYEARDGLRLAHYDFYRLSNAGIMSQELDESIHDPKTITVIEWGDIIQDILPENRITIKLDIIDDQHRALRFISRGNLRSRYEKDEKDDQ